MHSFSCLHLHGAKNFRHNIQNTMTNKVIEEISKVCNGLRILIAYFYWLHQHTEICDLPSLIAKLSLKFNVSFCYHSIWLCRRLFYYFNELQFSGIIECTSPLRLLFHSISTGTVAAALNGIRTTCYYRIWFY